MKVAIVMGSDSDFPVIRKCVKVLKDFKVDFEVFVISAHRTPARAAEFAHRAEENGFGVIIGAAGKAAHLAGVIAAHTTLPLIGLPIKASTLHGLDSFQSTVQMPKGIPVATVAIDGAENAALLSIQILALSDSRLKALLSAYKKKMEEEVEDKDKLIKAEVEKV